MMDHNSMRKNLIKWMADIQSYAFGSVLSNIEYKETLTKAGFLLSRIFQLLSSEYLQNYSLFSHDELFEKSYLFLSLEVNYFIASIKVSAGNVTQNGFEKWDKDSETICNMFSFSEQTSAPVKKDNVEDAEYE